MKTFQNHCVDLNSTNSTLPPPHIKSYIIWMIGCILMGLGPGVTIGHTLSSNTPETCPQNIQNVHAITEDADFCGFLNTQDFILEGLDSKLSHAQGNKSRIAPMVIDSLPLPVYCGEFVNPVQASYSTPDSIYYDRFGNTYNRAFDPPAAERADRSSTAGYFNLEFEDPITYQNEEISFSSEIQSIFNVVFEELSNIIEQRQFMDQCSNSLPVHEVHISIEWGASLPSNVIAAASPVFYHEPGICAGGESILVLGMPENKIKGFYPLPNGYDGKDAIILLNPKFVLEELLDTDYPAAVDINLYDLYTVVMHEAFHALGVISQIGPDPVDFITNFDRLLFSDSDSRFFIESNCNSACYSESFDESEKSALLQASCEVLIGVSGPSAISEVSFQPRVFSHLDNGSCESGYLMQPLTPPGTRRFPQEVEWNILCQLGYKLDVSSPAVNCDGCYLFAESIIRQPVDNFECLSGGCCQHDFHTCEDEIEISFDDLLCRVQSSDVSVSIIDAYAFSSGADVTLQNASILVERTFYGGVQIRFVAKGCENCQTTIGSVFVVFDQCVEETDPADVCDNMFLIGNFEEFEEVDGVNFGFPYIFEGFCNNTPDIKIAGGVKHVSLSGSFGESVTFKAVDVSEASDCDIKLDLEFYLSSTEDELLVWISEYPPCHGEFVPFGCDLSQSFICEDMSEYNPVCLNLDISGANYTQDEWHAETFIIPRSIIPANASAYYFIFSAISTAGGSVLVQSLKATCMVEPVITLDVSCMEVCMMIDGIVGDFLWDFGDGNSSTDMNPCHTYENPGTYVVTVSVDNECPWVIPDDITIEVAPCGGTNYCEEYDEMSNDWVIGTQPCSITNASDIWSTTTGIVGKKLLINGRLIMDKSMEFDQCVIEMGPHAEIFVKPFVIMRVASSTFYSCEYLWRSIRVGVNGALLVYKNNSEDEDNVIANAWTGIFAYTLSNLHLSDIVFDANMVGLYIPPVPTIPDLNLPTTLPNMVNLSKFDNLKFIGSELLTPYFASCMEDPFSYSNFFTVSPLAASYCGVLIHDVGPEINLSASSLESKILYSGMRSGIIAKRSNIKVENSRFNNIQFKSGSNYPYRGFGIAHIGEGHTLHQKGFGKNDIWSFRNVRVPIFVEGNHVTTKYNRMVQDIHTGIWTRLCKNRNLIMEDNFIQTEVRGINLFQNDPVNILRVTRNEVHMVNGQLSPNACIAISETQTPPIVEANYLENDLFFLENTAFGALISQSAVWHNIEDNRVSTTADGLLVINGNETFVRNNIVTGPGSHHGSGISVLASPSTFALCNELRSLRNGLSFFNENIVTRVGLNLFHEDFTNALYYNASGYTGAQINMKNEWCGNTAVTGGFEAKHESGMAAPASEYMILSSDGECFMPDPVDPTTGWFVSYPTLHNSLLCHEYERGREGALGDLERLIAQDSLDNPEGAPAWLWVQRYDLYRTLMEWPDTIWTGTLYGDFISWMDTTDVGTWYALEQDIKAILKEDTVLTNLRSDITDTTELWYASIAAQMDIVRNPSTSVQDSLDAIAQIDTLMMELDDFSLYWDAQRALLDSLREEAILDLMAQLDGAPASEDWTEALQTVWQTVLRISLYGPGILQGTLIDDLDALASECPQTHGKAVYLAGSILADIAVEPYSYDCIVAAPLITKADHTAVSSRDLIIYPVPASDRVVVQLGSDAPDGVIHITHVSGASVLSQRISGNMVELSVSHLPLGMYILAWKPDGAKAVSRVLTVQR